MLDRRRLYFVQASHLNVGKIVGNFDAMNNLRQFATVSKSCCDVVLQSFIPSFIGNDVKIAPDDLMMLSSESYGLQEK